MAFCKQCGRDTSDTFSFTRRHCNVIGVTRLNTGRDDRDHKNREHGQNHDPVIMLVHTYLVGGNPDENRHGSNYHTPRSSGCCTHRPDPADMSSLSIPTCLAQAVPGVSLIHLSAYSDMMLSRDNKRLVATSVRPSCRQSPSFLPRDRTHRTPEKSCQTSSEGLRALVSTYDRPLGPGILTINRNSAEGGGRG